MEKKRVKQVKEKDLVIFSNSPGEVSTWVAPVVERLGRHPALAEYRVFLVIHPCQFASGNEPFVAQSFPGIDIIVPPRQYMKHILYGTWKKRYGMKEEGVILSLGGSLKHPVFFKKRSRAPYPLYAYTNNPDLPGWEKSYERIFVRNEWVRDRYLKRGVPRSKLMIVGDLVRSTVVSRKQRAVARQELGIVDEETAIAFMPGSRDFEVLFMLPAFLRVIDDLTERVNNIRVFMLKSPYVPYEWVEKALQRGGEIKEGDTLGGTLLQEEGAFFIRLTGKKLVPILEGGLEEWGECIDFAVTLPGSNTIQLAYRKVPMLTVMPLNRPDIIPIVGVLAVVKWIPFIGRPILRKAALAYSSKFRFASLPNIYQNREIVPELFGVIKTEDITNSLLRIMGNDEIPKIRERLSVFDVEEDPAENIIRCIWG